MDRTLKRTSSIIAAIGLLDALYLSWVKLSNNEAACLPGLGDCTAVNLSRYSEIFGVPIAVLGSGAFLTILAVLFLEGRAYIPSDISQFIIFGISLIGTLYSIYLTYLEIFVIRAICPYCVISAIALVALLGLTLVRILRQNRNEP